MWGHCLEHAKHFPTTNNMGYPSTRQTNFLGQSYSLAAKLIHRLVLAKAAVVENPVIFSPAVTYVRGMGSSVVYQTFGQMIDVIADVRMTSLLV